ncbi:sister chromatid cohesion protein Dcc1 [Lipomyces arxii]|uniref:sister chromatid cohesion protein Dcc1 n=1 Tax=Lipomyces arxii TaxID=56418 RepID=UPI0034CDB5F5
MTSQQQGIALYSDPALSSRYRLIELTPDLMAVLQSPENAGHLQLKSAGKDAPTYLCAYDKTFQLRQISQSNTLLMLSPNLSDASDASTADLMNTDTLENRVYATTIAGGYIECIPSTPRIDLSFLPYYHGEGVSSEETGLQLTKEDVIARVPTSVYEFESAWIEALCVEIDGHAYRLGSGLVLRVVPVVMTAIQAERLDFKHLMLHEVMKALGDDEEPVQVIEAILIRFSTTRSQPFCLDSAQLTKYFGIKMLAEHAFQQPIQTDTFMTMWMESLPVVLPLSCELDCLAGQFVQPTPNTIKYLPSAWLPTDPAARFERLFAAKSTWLVDDIVPFILPIEPDRARINTLFMKFAKKKTMKGKAYVTKRGI